MKYLMTTGTIRQCCRIISLLAVLTLPAPSHAAFRAVLVGVSQFDHLPIQALDGPLNDVPTMMNALHALGVPLENITVLTDNAAPDRHPMRANILRALREQIQASRRGDWVVVYFSGHGAQVPQRQPVPKHRWVEPDGLDEVFLTRDTKLWDKKNRRVEGALLDDDIGDALAEFAAKGVHVWAIFDTCHAGDMARGTPRSGVDVIWRGIDPVTLGVPIKLLSRLAETRSKPSWPTRASAAILPREKIKATPAGGSVVTFYATQPDEAAPEEWYESNTFEDRAGGTVARRRYGVFTWELATALNKHPATFAELSQIIMQRYQARPSPTPLFEGNLSRNLLR